MRRDDHPAAAQRDVTQARLKPGQSWVCGYADIGQACRGGPTCDGKCGRLAGSEAVEVSEMADTTAIDASALAPCIPRRSLLARRQSLRLNLAILTGGLLMLCMALPSREKTFVPGELSSKHAQILDNTLAADRCGLCHPASHAPGNASGSDQLVNGLLKSAQRLIENDGRQDQLCMQCHTGHLPNAVHRDPHDLSPDMWQQLQQIADTPWQLVSTRSTLVDRSTDAGALVSGHSSKLSKTSCAMCHNEHHGRGFDIKLISDSRCQACHQRQFESLASGHPEFVNFPADRPRGLAFSHGRHAQDHFPKKSRDFDCKACHLAQGPSNSRDQVMRALSFEHACASCHDAPIRSATVDGWAAIQLPSIDANDVRLDPELGDWPDTARFGHDGFVSPVLRALLMDDPTATPALAKLPASGKLVDISTISDARGSVTRTLAKATRKLLSETARDGQAAWTTRLEHVTRDRLQRDLNAQEKALIAAMVAGIPPDLFRQAESQWLGSHKTLAQSNQVRGQLVKSSSLQQADKLGDTSDDLLAPPSASSSNADDLLSMPEDAPKNEKPKLVKGATHLASGGWYADPTTLAIRYMPNGHADNTLSAWTLWWSMIESHRPVLPESETKRMEQRLSLVATATAEPSESRIADQVPGKCTECHQVDHALMKFTNQTTAPGFNEVYRVPERDPSVREFTKFSHTAHLTLPALSNCRYCHQEKQPLPSAANEAKLHHPAHSEFVSMKLSQCAACHRAGGANDRCVQCHNYHVTQPLMQPSQHSARP